MTKIIALPMSIKGETECRNCLKNELKLYAIHCEVPEGEANEINITEEKLCINCGHNQYYTYPIALKEDYPQ